MVFGKRLKEVRTKRNLTQDELTAFILERISGGLKRNTISNYETGISKPKFEILLAIADILKCSIDYLLGLDSEDPAIIKSFHDVAALVDDPKQFRELYEDKVDGVKKILKDGDMDAKEANKHLRASVKMNEDLMRKYRTVHRKFEEARLIIKTHLPPD